MIKEICIRSWLSGQPVSHLRSNSQIRVSLQVANKRINMVRFTNYVT